MHSARGGGGATSNVASPSHVKHTETAAYTGIGRRAEMQALQLAIRRDIEGEEVECRRELHELYKYYTVDALEYAKRLPSIRKREESRTAAQLERQGDRARLLLPVTIAEEEEQRRNIVVAQEKDRRLIQTKRDRDHVVVCTIEKLQLLARAEDRKRYSLEKNELADFTALQDQYNATPWKPTIKVLGQCPFARKAHCPFQDRWKMCHGMPLAENHYEHSLVEDVGSGMM